AAPRVFRGWTAARKKPPARAGSGRRFREGESHPPAGSHPRRLRRAPAADNGLAPRTTAESGPGWRTPMRLRSFAKISGTLFEPATKHESNSKDYTLTESVCESALARVGTTV